MLGGLLKLLVSRGGRYDGIMIPVVECCIRNREERGQREARMVWMDTEVWTS